MAFDYSSGRFHLVGSALVLTLALTQRPFSRPTRSSTSNPNIPILRMFVLGQIYCCSSRHPPRAIESVPLVNSLGAESSPLSLSIPSLLREEGEFR
jgi:hypothetical protein